MSVASRVPQLRLQGPLPTRRSPTPLQSSFLAYTNTIPHWGRLKSPDTKPSAPPKPHGLMTTANWGAPDSFIMDNTMFLFPDTPTTPRETHASVSDAKKPAKMLPDKTKETDGNDSTSVYNDSIYHYASSGSDKSADAKMAARAYDDYTDSSDSEHIDPTLSPRSEHIRWMDANAKCWHKRRAWHMKEAMKRGQDTAQLATADEVVPKRARTRNPTEGMIDGPTGQLLRFASKKKDKL